MRDFQIKRQADGSFALYDLQGRLIDGFLVQDTGQEPVKVVATARMDHDGQKFYVTVPATRALLKHQPQVVEERLRVFAEHWERGYKAADTALQ